MSLKSKAIMGAKWTSTSSLVIVSLNFIQLAVLARLLNPSAFGLMGMVMVVIGFSRVFADMGISNAIIQRENPTSQQLSSLYWLNIFSGIIIFALFILATPYVAMFYDQPKLKDLMYWASIIFLITPFGQQFQILLQKELEFNRLAKIEVFSELIRSISTIAFAFFGFGVHSLVWGQIINTICKTLSFILINWKIWHPKFHFNKNDLKGYLSFGIYQLGDRSLSFFKGNLDNIVIGKLLGAEALGLYTIAFNIIILPVTRINPILTRVAFPVFSKLQKQNDKFKVGYLQLLSLLCIVNFPIFFGLATTAHLFIPILYGNKWLPSIVLVQILAGIGLLRSIGNPIGSLVLAKGRADLGFKWSFSTFIIQVPVAIISVWYGGIVGISVAFLILQLFFSALEYILLVRKLLSLPIKEYISSIWTPFFMSIIMALIIIAISLFLSKVNNKIELTILISVGIFIYFSLFYAFRKRIEFLKAINLKNVLGIISRKLI